MDYLILLIFFIVCLLAYLEDYIPKNYKYPIFVFFGVCLLLIAGTKEIGIDPDSENYASAYRTCFAESDKSSYEFSYIYICRCLNYLTDDPHAIFFFYAFFGLAMKFLAIIKLNQNMIFLSLAVYLSYVFELHEMMQIRTAILSGLFLLAVKAILDKKRLLALLFICIGGIFHVSAVILLPFVFFSTKPIGKKEKIFLITFIILSLGASFSGNGILDVFSNLPYVGDKIELYTSLADHGISVNRVNGLGIFNLLTVAISIYLLFFSSEITEEDSNYPLLMRIYACGVAAYTLFSFIPEVGARVSALYKTVSIVLFADIVYTMRPGWAAVLVVEIVSLIFMHYGLQFLGFDFLWATEI